MKIVVCADLHVHARKLESADGGRDRLEDGLSALRQTLEFARTRDCPWAFLGDVKEPRRSWPVDALTGVLAVLEEFPNVPKLFVKGNHDGEDDHGSGLRPFASLPRATVIEKPESMYFGDHEAFVLPAVSDKSVSAADWIASAPTSATILLGHGFISGAMLGPDDFRGEGELTLEALGMLGREPRFKVALFGDVHKGQVLARGRGRGRAPGWVPFSATAHVASSGLQPIRYPGDWRGEIFYAGSTYQQNWGEREDGPKGALLVDLDSGEVSLLHVLAPRYVQDEWPSSPTAVEIGGDGYVTRWHGNFVRVVAGPWAREKKYAEALHRLVETAEPRSFALDVIEPKAVEQRAEVHAAMGAREMCEAYVAARPLDGVAPEHVTAAGVSLMEKD